jgi:hypothetical protein
VSHERSVPTLGDGCQPVYPVRDVSSGFEGTRTWRFSSGSKRNPAEKLRFFASQAAWRRWLAANHDKSTGPLGRVPAGRDREAEHHVAAVRGRGSLLRMDRRNPSRLDDESYAIRFSPRANSSRWSRLNLKRHAELEAQGHVPRPGRKRVSDGRGRTRRPFKQDCPRRARCAVAREFEPELGGSPLLGSSSALVPNDRRPLGHEREA